MTNTLNQAAEALRTADRHIKATGGGNSSGWAQTCIADALAAIKAEQSRVPPDREALARRVIQMRATMSEHGATGPWIDLADDVIAALRIPAPGAGAWREEERRRIKDGLDFRLNERLCEMKPNWDDSITGFNDAWDIVRAYFAAPPSLPDTEGTQP